MNAIVVDRDFTSCGNIAKIVSTGFNKYRFICDKFDEVVDVSDLYEKVKVKKYTEESIEKLIICRILSEFCYKKCMYAVSRRTPMHQLIICAACFADIRDIHYAMRFKSKGLDEIRRMIADVLKNRVYVKDKYKVVATKVFSLSDKYRSRIKSECRNIHLRKLVWYDIIGKIRKITDYTERVFRKEKISLSFKLDTDRVAVLNDRIIIFLDKELDKDAIKKINDANLVNSFIDGEIIFNVKGYSKIF